MQDDRRSLLVRLDTDAQRDDLIRFLRSRACECGTRPGPTVLVENCDEAAGGLATLVAMVEEWRAGAHVAEAVLEVGAERRILRTDP